MSLWNPENIRDVAESVGIPTLQKDISDNLARDVEYRISQVLEEALKFMRHGKRTTLTTQDITQALRVLDVEPLYGYESTRPLRFGEASIGPGQPLFYVEDEEVDFEKLINAPLPKVPREISFTAHWLAVEGVQPSIPQNPTSAESKHQELLPKGPNTSSNLAAISGSDSVSVKPLVKHVLSKELQLYFERVCSALLDENDDEYRLAALASLRTDPGLHQLVPYFVQFLSEKVTHNLKNLFVLTQMIHLASALLENPSLYVEPYVASIVPPILTCLIGRRLGNGNNASSGGNGAAADPLAHFALRDISASLLLAIARKYGKSSHTLKPRLARTCLRHFLDPNKLFGSHYGALVGLQGLTGPEGVRTLVLPNLKDYEALVLKDGIASDESKKAEAEMVVKAIMAGLESLERDTKTLLRDSNGTHGSDGNSNSAENMEEERRRERSRLVEVVGEVIGERILQTGRQSLVRAVLSFGSVV